MANNKLILTVTAVLAILVFNEFSTTSAAVTYEFSACEYKRNTSDAVVKYCHHVGVDIPQCEEDGTYSSLQRFPSRGLVCCAHPRTGQGCSSTCTRPPAVPICPKNELSNCEEKQAEARRRHLLGVYVPRCEKDGSYAPLQFKGSQKCCATTNTGKLRNCINIGARRRPACNIYEYSKCQVERAVGKIKTRCGMVGVSIPQCEDDGSYSPVQCNGSTGFCCCANPETGHLSNCVRVPNKPDCK